MSTIPHFVGLRAKMREDSAWEVQYKLRRMGAWRLVNGAPLVHVMSDFAQFLRAISTVEPMLRATGVTKSANTAHAEINLSVPPSIYFYNGHCFPRTQGVAFAFPSSIIDNHQG